MSPVQVQSESEIDQEIHNMFTDQLAPFMAPGAKIEMTFQQVEKILPSPTPTPPPGVVVWQQAYESPDHEAQAEDEPPARTLGRDEIDPSDLPPGMSSDGIGGGVLIDDQTAQGEIVYVFTPFGDDLRRNLEFDWYQAKQVGHEAWSIAAGRAIVAEARLERLRKVLAHIPRSIIYAAVEAAEAAED